MHRGRIVSDQVGDSLDSCRAAWKTFCRKSFSALCCVGAHLNRFEMARSARVPHFDGVEIEHETPLAVRDVSSLHSFIRGMYAKRTMGLGQQARDFSTGSAHKM